MAVGIIGIILVGVGSFIGWIVGICFQDDEIKAARGFVFLQLLFLGLGIYLIWNCGGRPQTPLQVQVVYPQQQPQQQPQQ